MNSLSDGIRNAIAYIEAYPEMPHEDPAEDYCEIWIPVKKVSE